MRERERERKREGEKSYISKPNHKYILYCF